jgi:hypothetical protein
VDENKYGYISIPPFYVHGVDTKNFTFTSYVEQEQHMFGNQEGMS